MLQRKKIYGIIVALLTIIIPYLIMISDPQVETSRSLCPFKLLTGLPCPGCGFTKSVISFYKGDLVKSIHYHAFGAIVILFCIAAIVILSIEIFTKKEYRIKLFYNHRITYALTFIFASYYFTRLFIFISSTSLSDIISQSIWK